MRVVVTGGAGYIGSVVVARLVGSGHAVTVVDDLSKGHRDAIARGAELAVCDLGDAAELASILKAFAPDAVVHLAARSLVGESMAIPGTYYRQNVSNTLNVLEAMDATGCKSIVFSSTAAVYGEPELEVGGTGIVEETPTIPTNVYGETKLAAERMIGWYAATRGFRTIALRYFNASGAVGGLGEDHRPEAHLIPNVLQVALGQAPNLAVYGGDHPTPDGTPIRDYVHVTDLAVAHIRNGHARYAEPWYRQRIFGRADCGDGEARHRSRHPDGDDGAPGWRPTSPGCEWGAGTDGPWMEPLGKQH